MKIAAKVGVRPSSRGKRRLTADWLASKSSELTREIALRTSAQAKLNAHVRTGRMKKSIVSRKGSGGSWMVRVGAYYGIYENYGTRYRPAHPFFTTAVEQVRQELPAIAKEVFDRKKAR